ncbi:MerC domain-containing protein [Croceitalea dokdonensis]|uniref:MerC domain-containing protein n=1 Tax=Croceitalea dokdonensis TaxID=346188 RepID=UPI00155DC60C|nr:MerC domain-containing protein [Croceitalea dokdonensis]
MRAIVRFKNQPNIWGSFASGLCLAHCIGTPFLFAAHAGHVQGHHSAPQWWGFIDILFLVISFFSVFLSSRHTSKKWISYLLWLSWASLALIILNEKIGMFHIKEEVIYIPSISLIIFHLYNTKYCQCQDEECCALN